MRILMGLLLASVSLGALCRSAAADDGSQIRVVSYSALLRTEIVGIIGQPTTITFPKGEAVYRVVQSGKPDKEGGLADAGWQGASPSEVKDTPLGNNLTLWPVIQGTSTMSVITMTAAGDQKVYAFRLTALPNDQTALGVSGIVLNLIFKGSASTPNGPEPVGTVTRPSASAIQAWREKQKAKQADQEVAEERIRVEAFNRAGDACHYHAHGKKPNAITPRCPMSNGQWVLMRFPGLSKKPAIYTGTCEDGKDEERLARQHESGDFVVVEEIAPRFCLRLGSDVLDIVDDAFDPVGNPTGGSIAPGVQRDLLRQAAKAP